jgi:hypothetical protein
VDCCWMACPCPPVLALCQPTATALTGSSGPGRPMVSRRPLPGVPVTVRIA